MHTVNHSNGFCWCQQYKCQTTYRAERYRPECNYIRSVSKTCSHWIIMYVSDSTMTDLNVHLVYFPCLLQHRMPLQRVKMLHSRKEANLFLCLEVADIVGVCAAAAWIWWVWESMSVWSEDRWSPSTSQMFTNLSGGLENLNSASGLMLISSELLLIIIWIIIEP